MPPPLSPRLTTSTTTHQAARFHEQANDPGVSVGHGGDERRLSALGGDAGVRAALEKVPGHADVAAAAVPVSRGVWSVSQLNERTRDVHHRELLLTVTAAPVP